MILDAILGRPKALAPNPMDDYWYQPVSRPTASGVRVDESTAFNYSVCWAATRLLAGTSGWLPFNLHKRKTGGGSEIDQRHRVHRLIHSQPNRDMGAMMFRCRGVNHQVNWGNTFAEIVRNNGGQPFSLEPIHPRRLPSQNIVREDGKIVYYVLRPDGVGKPQRVTQENMFHVPSIISEDGIIGKGVITAARESIGKAIGTQSYGAASLKNGGAPPLALKGGKFKNKEERAEYRREINEVHGGAANAGKWLLLPPDAEVEKLGFSLEDSQFIETSQFDIEEVARWYGVPPHLVGHLLRATFNNIEELGVSFVKYSLIQWLKLWEQEVWRKLLTEAEQETHYAKFNVDALERGNLATRTEAGVKKFFNGLWTLNDWASQEDMNPIAETAEVDGKEVSLGDMHFVQQAMIPLAQAAKGPAPAAGPQSPAEPPPTDTPDDEPLQAVRKDVAALATNSTALALSVERIVAAVNGLQSEQRQLTEATNNGLQSLRLTVETNHAAALDGIRTLAVSVEAQQATLASSAAVQKSLAGAMVKDVLCRLLSVETHNVKNMAQTASKFDQRLSAFYDKHRKTMEAALLSPCGAALTAAGRTEDATRFVQSFIDGHVAQSMQQLLALCDCQAEELPGRVEQCVSQWNGERTSVGL